MELKTKLIDKNSIIESLVSFKRAGANAIVSYYADRIDQLSQINYFKEFKKTSRELG